jgi:hypothetical protein
MPHECAACHVDPHQGRLGASCTSCHDTNSWKHTSTSHFDHERTSYPLRGRHATVACEKCHPPGKPLRVAHERCSDCHADVHLRQFARRADRGRCESCHDLDGFVPARYSVDDHQKSAFALTGAHLAVACNACHRKVPALELVSVDREIVVPNHAPATTRFRFASERCADCHRDPHRGEVDRWKAKDAGCEVCHRVETWHQVAFDHSKTRYALVGAHQRVACTKCHAKVDVGTPRERLRFTGLDQGCASCHPDPHRGQFARGGETDCGRCHTVETLKATTFDHNRDADWPLKGAHQRVPCHSCHKPVTEAGVTFVRYRDAPTACKGCHGNVRELQGGEESRP